MSMQLAPHRLAAALALAVALAGPRLASAQLLGPPPQIGVPLLGQAPDELLKLGRSPVAVAGDVNRLTSRALAPEALISLRRARLADYVRRRRSALEIDPSGDPVVRGRLLALSPGPEALAKAGQAGFAILSRQELSGLGVSAVVLATPSGLSTSAALAELRRLGPAGTYDFDSIYLGAGRPTGGRPAGSAQESSTSDAPGGPVGLIDTGVDSALPVFRHVRIVERSFAPGGPAPAPHGDATASLISGRLGAFHGSDPGAGLQVADIYGRSPAGGSALALAEALDWLVASRVAVVNISLVGPANALVGAAVHAALAHGCLIVAAVGNDGPAAPPSYPASYEGVIAVTAVDRRDRILPEAGRSLHVDFAAPGADMEAAAAGGGLAPVRGTSFAAPIVAGELARRLPRPDRAEAARAVASLSLDARPAGPRAGRGVVGAAIRFAADADR